MSNPQLKRILEKLEPFAYKPTNTLKKLETHIGYY